MLASYYIFHEQKKNKGSQKGHTKIYFIKEPLFKKMQNAKKKHRSRFKKIKSSRL
jgi:hypothetical protein